MASSEDADAGDAPVDSAAAALRSASFVRLVVHADAGAVAAAGLLARAADADGVPFQVTVVRTAREADRRMTAGDGAAIAVGVGAQSAPSLTALEVPIAAAETARAVGHDPDPSLVLTGLVARGISPEGTAAFEAADLERRPGVGVPTDDPVEGIAHTTLLHGAFSGDPAAAEQFLEDGGVDADDIAATSDLDAGTCRRIGSLVALETSRPATGDRGLAALGRALHPLVPGGRFATVAGDADVLAATTRESPGTAIALVLGHDRRESALGTWRDHALRVHRTVQEADLARHSGLAVAEVDGGVWTAARLLRDFRSPEPVALAIGDGEAALAGPPGTDATAVLSTAAEECAGSAAGTDSRAYVAFDGTAEDLVAVARGLL